VILSKHITAEMKRYAKIVDLDGTEYTYDEFVEKLEKEGTTFEEWKKGIDEMHRKRREKEKELEKLEEQEDSEDD